MIDYIIFLIIFMYRIHNYGGHPVYLDFWVVND